MKLISAAPSPPKLPQSHQPTGFQVCRDIKNYGKPDPTLSLWVKEFYGNTCFGGWRPPREKIKTTKYGGIFHLIAPEELKRASAGKHRVHWCEVHLKSSLYTSAEYFCTQCIGKRELDTRGVFKG